MFFFFGGHNNPQNIFWQKALSRQPQLLQEVIFEKGQGLDTQAQLQW